MEPYFPFRPRDVKVGGVQNGGGQKGKKHKSYDRFIPGRGYIRIPAKTTSAPRIRAVKLKGDAYRRKSYSYTNKNGRHVYVPSATLRRGQLKMPRTKKPRRAYFRDSYNYNRNGKTIHVRGTWIGRKPELAPSPLLTSILRLL